MQATSRCTGEKELDQEIIREGFSGEASFETLAENRQQLGRCHARRLMHRRDQTLFNAAVASRVK